MFELRLVQGSLLKKVVDSIKDLVTEANFDCSSTGFSLQAMDSSHVALVSLLLRSEGFEHYRCDRSISMGINITNLAKVLRCADGEDIITLKADDGTDTVTFMFESPTQDKISDYEMKLMDIDSEHLGIPEADYEAIVRMPTAEFSNICRSLGAIGDTVTISVSKQGVTFSTKGDIGSGNITCRHNTSVDKPEEATVIEMQEPVSLSFAIKYINTFTKASPLASQVTISMSRDLPIVIEYRVAEMGYVRFYLAPKVEEDEEYENRANGETAAPPAVNKEMVRVEQDVGEFGKQGKENRQPEERLKEEMEGEKSQMKVEASGKDEEDMETEDGVAGEVKMEDGCVADVTL